MTSWKIRSMWNVSLETYSEIEQVALWVTSVLKLSIISPTALWECSENRGLLLKTWCRNYPQCNSVTECDITGLFLHIKCSILWSHKWLYSPFFIYVVVLPCKHILMCRIVVLPFKGALWRTGKRREEKRREEKRREEKRRKKREEKRREEKTDFFF